MRFLKISVLTMAMFLLLCIVGAAADDSGVAPLDKISKLVIALIPSEKPEDIKKQYSLLRDLLEKKIGMPVEMFVASDYTGVVEAMRAGKVHIGFFGPFSFVLAKQRANAEAFAIPVVISDKTPNGSVVYHSILMTTPAVSKEIGISTPQMGVDGMKKVAAALEKFKKKYSMAFTDPASTSGCNVPKYYMMKAGMDPEAYFSSIGYVGTHDASSLGVANNTINFGFSNNDDFANMVAKGKVTTATNIIIWNSDDIPQSPVAMRADMPGDLKQKIIAIFKDAPGELFSGPGTKYKNFQIIDSKLFDVIEDIQKALNLKG